MTEIAIRDLPDNIYDTFLNSKRIILDAIKDSHPGMQISILEFVLAEVIYFHIEDKADRERIVNGVCSNIISNFKVFDERLEKIRGLDE
jgi:hypothetical protein